VVEEAQAFGRYVCAHAYTPEAITRAMQGGVRTIEHGNLIDEPAARLMAEKGAFLVANLVTYHAMKERAAQLGMSADMLAKNDVVLEAGYRSLEICQRAEVPVAYGSDLLGPLQEEQSREFLIRGEVMKPIEVIRSATTVAARVLRREGTLGVIAPEALADLLLVDGNPLQDLGLFQKQGTHLPVIMKGGAFHKNLLS
jgi:imidazolonepropionase-like amidohydrolase